MPRWRRLLIAGGLVYAAAGLAVSLIWFPLGDLDVESDFYAELGPAAQHIAAGDLHLRHHPYKGPLQPLLTAAMHAGLGPLGVSWYRCAVGVSIAAGLLALWATYRLCRSLADERVGVAAVVLMASSHLIFVNSHKAASDMLFLGLATLAVAVALDRGPARGRRWFVAGLLAGAAYLTRYIGLLLVPWLAGVALLRPGRRGRDAALAVAGFLILAAPWSILSLIQTGEVLASRNAESVAREFAGAGFLAHLGHFLLNVPRRVVEFARTGIGVTAVVAALGGLALSWRRGHDWRWRACLAWAATYLLGLATVFYLPRFALPLLPVIALLIALLLVGGGVPWLAARRHALGWLGVAAFVALGVVRTVSVEKFHRADLPTHLQGTVAYLATLAGPDPPVLMARKAHAAFLAGLPWRPYPTREMAAGPFVADAASRGADLILAGPVERRLGAGGFAMQSLERLTGVTRVHEGEGNVVYRIDRSLPVDRLGHDPRADSLAVRFATECATGDLRAVSTAEALALARLEVGDPAGAQAALQAVVSAYGDQPGVDLLRVRVNLAWVCLRSGDAAAGAAALDGTLPRLGAGGDRLLEARAHDYLGRHLAGLGRLAEARPTLQRAAALYAGLRRADERAQVEALLARLPGAAPP